MATAAHKDQTIIHGRGYKTFCKEKPGIIDGGAQVSLKGPSWMQPLQIHSYSWLEKSHKTN